MALIVHAAYAFPDGALAADFAVAVEGQRIAAAGPLAAVRAQYPDAEIYGGAGYLMLPGFVNAHDHGRAFGTASLSVPDHILEGWLPMLGALPGLPPYLAAAWEGVQLLRSGVTVAAHSHNPASWEGMFDEAHDTIRGYRDAGVRLAFHPPMIDQNTLVYADAEAFIAGLPADLQADARARTLPPPYTIDSYLAGCTALYDRYHDADGYAVHIQVSPAGGQWCSDALILASTEWALARKTRVQMHMLETKYQRAYAFRAWETSFIAHLEAIGALGDWLTLAHMVWTEPDDLPRLAAHGAGVSHNPSANLRLRSGIAPAADYVAAGVRTGVGLDGHALDDDQDYLRELRLAYTLAALKTAPFGGLSAETVLKMGTVTGAAITFGADAPLGRLSAGMLADLVLIDLDAVRGPWAPSGYPEHDSLLEFVLHRASRAHVRDVMVGGAWKLRDGRAVGVDDDALAAEIRGALAAQDWEALRARRAYNARLAEYISRFYAAWDVVR